MGADKNSTLIQRILPNNLIEFRKQNLVEILTKFYTNGRIIAPAGPALKLD